MSRSTISTVTNPAAFFAEWSSEAKCLKFYEKFDKPNEKGEKGINRLIGMPFRFMVLDTLATIKGYNEKLSSNYYSNEVRNIKTDTLSVYCGGIKAADGLYNDVIGKLTGAKFCQSVYIVCKGKQDYKIANIQIKGAALGEWIEFRKKNKNAIFKHAVEVIGYEEAKKGKTIYFKPVFALMPCSKGENDVAIEFDKELQKYLNEYMKVSVKQDIPDVVDTEEQIPNKGAITDKLYSKNMSSGDFPPPHTENDLPPVTDEEDDGQLPF